MASAVGHSTFSIVIPTYNSAKTLVRCLDSIVGQDYTNFEICFVDGVSTDDTLSIIAAYQLTHPCIKFISEPDKGIYDAMNKGINMATGQWLYFLGSDDTLYSNKVLSAIAAKISTSVNAKVIYGSVIMRGQNQWNLDNVVYDGEYTIEKFIDRNICHQAMFYNHSFLKTIGGFNLKYVTDADFDLNLRCYARAKFDFIDLIIANFFVGGASTTIEDHQFHKDRGALLMKYFGGRIFTISFINARLYIQQAALTANSPLNIFGRFYCLSAYIKLKLQAMLTRS